MRTSADIRAGRDRAYERFYAATDRAEERAAYFEILLWGGDPSVRIPGRARAIRGAIARWLRRLAMRIDL